MSNEFNAPDPAGVSAAEFAVEATNDPEKAHPWLSKFIIFAAIFVIVLGTFGATIGTVNTIQLRAQNAVLQKESKCQTLLLETITKEQRARAAISADDRSAQKLYAQELIKADTADERQDAYNKYQKQLKINDAKRATYPVPTFSETACKAVENDKNNIITSTSPSTGKSVCVTVSPATKDNC